MKRTITTLTATAALVLSLAACGQTSDRLVCVDKVSGYAFDEDDQCDPDDDDYAGLGVFLVMTAKQYDAWKNSSNKYGYRLTGLSAPKTGDKMRTVYSSSKKKTKVKSPAIKSRTSTGTKSSFGSTTKKSSSTNKISSSTGRRK